MVTQTNVNASCIFRSFTSDGVDDVLQLLVIDVAVEQGVRHVRVDVLVVATGAVDDGRQGNLRWGVDQEGIREENFSEKPLDFLSENFCVRLEGPASGLKQ